LYLEVICEKQTAGGHVLTQNQHDHEGLCDSVCEPNGGSRMGAGGAPRRLFIEPRAHVSGGIVVQGGGPRKKVL